MFNQIKDNSKDLQARYEALKKQREAQNKAQEAQARLSTESSQNLPKESTKKRGK